jgi:hypothetical protein
VFLILDITTEGAWPKIPQAPAELHQLLAPVRIPHEDRPTVLQRGTRKEAETEIVRLLQQSPGRTYALFECIGSAHTEVVPWAVTGAGAVVEEVRVPRWVSP